MKHSSEENVISLHRIDEGPYGVGKPPSLTDGFRAHLDSLLNPNAPVETVETGVHDFSKIKKPTDLEPLDLGQPASHEKNVDAPKAPEKKEYVVSRDLFNYLKMIRQRNPVKFAVLLYDLDGSTSHKRSVDILGKNRDKGLLSDEEFEKACSFLSEDEADALVAVEQPVPVEVEEVKEQVVPEPEKGNVVPFKKVSKPDQVESPEDITKALDEARAEYIKQLLEYQRINNGRRNTVGKIFASLGVADKPIPEVDRGALRNAENAYASAKQKALSLESGSKGMSMSLFEKTETERERLISQIEEASSGVASRILKKVRGGFDKKIGDMATLLRDFHSVEEPTGGNVIYQGWRFHPESEAPIKLEVPEVKVEAIVEAQIPAEPSPIETPPIINPEAYVAEKPNGLVELLSPVDFEGKKIYFMRLGENSDEIVVLLDDKEIAKGSFVNAVPKIKITKELKGSWYMAPNQYERAVKLAETVLKSPHIGK